jgi:hypothetical protein
MKRNHVLGGQYAAAGAQLKKTPFSRARSRESIASRASSVLRHRFCFIGFASWFCFIGSQSCILKKKFKVNGRPLTLCPLCVACRNTCTCVHVWCVRELQISGLSMNLYSHLPFGLGNKRAQLGIECLLSNEEHNCCVCSWNEETNCCVCRIVQNIYGKCLCLLISEKSA